MSARLVVHLAVLLAVGTMMVAGSFLSKVWAQPPDDRGSILFEGHDTLKGFTLDDIKAELEFLARWNQNEVKQESGSSRKSTDLSLEETLNLSTSGFVYHPNILEFTLSGGFGLRQQTTDVDGTSTDANGTLTEYGATMRVLRKEMFPIFAHASRTEGFVTRQFGPSLNTSSNIYGVQVDWNSNVVPSSFTYEHRDENQTEQRGPSDFNISEDTFGLNGEYRPSSAQQLNWAYSFRDTTQSGANRTSSSFSTQNFQASHSWDFGKGRLDRLFSSIDFLDRSGDFPLSRLRWNETLHLRHTKQLNSDYQYSYDHNEFEDLARDQHQFNARFTHQFYSSILTTGSVGGSLIQQSDGFNSNEYFGNLAINYRKIVPYGILSSGISYGQNVQENTAGPAGTRIRGEAHVFDDPNPIVLNRQNIIISSIVVMDITGTIVYTEGLDYTVTDLITRVEIRRVLGGLIADGDTVLLDYNLRSEGSDTTTTETLGFNVRYTFDRGIFKNLSVYGRYFQQNQSVDGGIGSTRLADDVRELIYGVDYEIGDLRLTAEQQMHDSRTAPFDATRLEAGYTRRLGDLGNLGLSASYRLNESRDARGDRNELFTLSGRYRARLWKRLNLTVDAIWRDEDSTFNGNTQGFDQNFGITWDHRQTHIFLEARNSFLDRETGSSTSQSLVLGVTRRF